jgi:hypothetical protein
MIGPLMFISWLRRWPNVKNKTKNLVMEYQIFFSFLHGTQNCSFFQNLCASIECQIFLIFFWHIEMCFQTMGSYAPEETNWISRKFSCLLLPLFLYCSALAHRYHRRFIYFVTQNWDSSFIITISWSILRWKQEPCQTLRKENTLEIQSFETFVRQGYWQKKT